MGSSPQLNEYSYDYNDKVKGFEIDIGPNTIRGINQNEYKITDLVPGLSYELTTSVFNRGRTQIFRDVSVYWPTSNLSSITTFSKSDFESNLGFSNVNNTITCDISNLEYKGNVDYILFLADVSRRFYLKTDRITASSDDVNSWTSNVLDNYNESNNLEYNLATMELHFSVIIDDLYVLSHHPVESSSESTERS